MPDQAGSTQAKLLIVDDKAANLDLLREMLAPLGHQIFFATSGVKALEIAISALPDLVLLDVMMPEMDGFETCHRFKQDATLSEIPIIFVTARTDVEDLARGFAAGAVDYITKPVKQPEVHARVATHLRMNTKAGQRPESGTAMYIHAITFGLDDTLWDNRPVLIAAEQSLYDWLGRHYSRIKLHYSLGSL